MDLSAIIIILVGALLFFGSIAWMAVYSRRNLNAEEQNEIE